MRARASRHRVVVRMRILWGRQRRGMTPPIPWAGRGNSLGQACKGRDRLGERAFAAGADILRARDYMARVAWSIDGNGSAKTTIVRSLFRYQFRRLPLITAMP